jgi:hypothetical protein
MTYMTIHHEDHRGYDKEIEVQLERELSDTGEVVDVISEGMIVYFTVYTVTRYYFSDAEGGCWDNWTTHKLSIPFRYSSDVLDLMIEKETPALTELSWGNIYHSTGGQECFVMIEREAGSQASNERAYYC